MVPRADIIAWRSSGHNWQSDMMVEQDLIISRVLIALFENEVLRQNLVFRGGTALHKVIFQAPLRYSEDIDLVQRHEGAIGAILSNIRDVLESWMGKPRVKQGTAITNLVFRLLSEDAPPLPMKIKVEINTREHFQCLPIVDVGYSVSNRWFSGSTAIPVYDVHELLATKLRALYQRRKGRDLLDLAYALRTLEVDSGVIMEVFMTYMRTVGHHVTYDAFCKNLDAKIKHPGFISDCLAIVRPGVSIDMQSDYELIKSTLLERLK